MAAIHLAKKALFGTSSTSLPHTPTTSILFSGNYFFTACHRADQCGNAIAEGRNLTSVLPDQKSRGDKKNARNCEAKDQAQKINDDNDDDDDDMISGVTGFVADTARKSATKAMDTAEAVGETVKQAMDSANFDVKEETTSTQNMKETVVVADTNVVNTAEYRSNQDAAKQTDIKEGY